MRHALLAAPLALLAACDGLLFAELQVAEIRVTLPSQAFPASDTSVPEFFCDPTGQSTPPCIALAVSYDLGADVPVLDEPNVTYDLRLTDVALTVSANQGVTDLSGVARATLRVFDPALPAGPGTVIANYVRPPGAAAIDAFAVTGDSNLDLGPYLDRGVLPLRVELVVDAPLPAFAADIEAGFSLEVNLDYGAYL